MHKERTRRPGGAAGGQAALAGGVAPAAEAQSWSRLAALIMRATGRRHFCQAFFRAVHNFFSLHVVASGKPRVQGGRFDYSQRRPPPVSEAPHETGVSGFAEVSKRHWQPGFSPERRTCPRRARLRGLPAYANRTRAVKRKNYWLWAILIWATARPLTRPLRGLDGNTGWNARCTREPTGRRRRGGPG